MANKSAWDYVVENDFEGAVERYQTANARWRGHWWECVETIYKQCAEWSKKYILDPITRTITQVINTVKNVTKKRSHSKNICCSHGAKVAIIYKDNCGEDIDGRQECYLFKFFDGENPEPIFSKIGTTTCTVNKRLRREIGDYRKNGFDIQRVEIDRIYNCGEWPAEGAESMLRAKLIKMFPGTWHKNDRFFGVNIPVDIFDNICAEFAAL